MKKLEKLFNSLMPESFHIGEIEPKYQPCQACVSWAVEVVESINSGSKIINITDSTQHIYGTYVSKDELLARLKEGYERNDSVSKL